MSAPQIDLDKLEQAAKAALQHSDDTVSEWWVGDELMALVGNDADAAFIAAASPLVVLELIGRARAAEENYQAATLRANANAEMLKGLQSQSPAVADRDAIRRIFMAHGFTIKEGQTDLKPYVYEAAEALLRELSTAVGVPVGELRVMGGIKTGYTYSNAAKYPDGTKLYVVPSDDTDPESGSQQ